MVVQALISWISGDQSQHNMTLLTSVSSLWVGSLMDERWREATDMLTVKVEDLFDILMRNGFPWHLFSYVLLLLLALMIYRIAFTPLNRVKNMEDVGWGCLGPETGKNIAEKIRKVQRLRKTGELPPSYPNGWFAVTESRNVSVAQVIPVQALGQSLAVFRGQDGAAYVTDAYCPHIGANLAVGGVVKGNRLECPFHGWQFDGSDGSCVYIPNCAKVPKAASVKHWPSREMNGFIFVWHDAEGRSPLWELKEISNIKTNKWSYRGRTSHEVLAHIQEIPENGADLAHIRHLHVPNILKGSDLRNVFTDNQVMDIAQHVWDGEWEALAEPECHIAKLDLTHSIALFGGKYEIVNINVKAEQIGPGVVHMHFNTNLGAAVLVQTVTPVEPLRQRMVQHFYSSSTFITPFAKLALLSEAYQMERDIMIWNNKQFLSQPMYVKEDRFIKKFRTWYSQFYSPNSEQFTFRKDSLDW